MSDTATVESPPAEAASQPAANGEAKEKRAQAGMYISTPEPLKARIEQEAKSAGKAPRVYVRDLLAQHWGLTLPEPRTRSTYANDEEKAAAQKAKRVERQELIKRLLAAHKQAQATGTELNTQNV